jgi:extradiol dioxygenase family protein
MLRPFHLAIAVHDLMQARGFYGGLLGCPEGRSSDTWIDFNLYGHQFVCHLDSQRSIDSAPGLHSSVDNDQVPVPHFGVVLRFDEWETLVRQLNREKLRFLIEPHIRFQGEAGQQGTFFIADPSSNILEFKGFLDLDQLFARND